MMQMEMLIKMLMHTITMAVYFAEQMNLDDVVMKLFEIQRDVAKHFKNELEIHERGV